MHSHAEIPRGILNASAAENKFRLTWYPPSTELSLVVERYWIVEWDLTGQEPYRQEKLPHPCVNLVVEKGNTRIFGVEREKTSYLLQGKGKVFGIKFKPGSFYPFVQTPVSTFTDGSLSIREVFGVDGHLLEQEILSSPDAKAMVQLAENLIRRKLPGIDENVRLIHQIVGRAIADPEMMKVDDLSREFAVHPRTLQRLFRQYVGVSPKWVLKRYRLHEAANRVESGEVPDWRKLALDLGYYDQSHFIRDFKRMIGSSPQEYASRCAGGAGYS
ncbi:AraC family transcriptional regulator [Brevibacillus humidisoli]|uniref:helix-turn-helix domain-containing protein n=1 Tax=Brevibacillus humidisoli TaxID=2895522 RepID=UPI001E550EA0|nr:AraC family transcriptional regulator [Brevibacillus humidisoli]UFJ39550.1 AraC family transcriptional regulator [Brevibacillus humidisoli]